MQYPLISEYVAAIREAKDILNNKNAERAERLIITSRFALVVF